MTHPKLVEHVIPSSRVLITGGAGFIGSHFVDALIRGSEHVCVYDNLSGGSLENVSRWMANPRFVFRPKDLRTIEVSDMQDCEIVLHLAANPEVRTTLTDPATHFQQNVEATFALLEAVRRADSIKTLVFTSSSTVYGDASIVPTPEDYSPLEPISVYGASKLACEALITAYAHTYGFRAVIYRLANIVGPRSRHGVTYDFVQKLKKDPKRLEILGDGTQRKSYLYIDDLIESIILSLEKSNRRVEVLNVGSEDQVDVGSIAQIVIEEMELKGISLAFTGGVDGGRGWKGDVKNMHLDIKKLMSYGWSPKHTSADAIRLTARKLIQADSNI